MTGNLNDLLEYLKTHSEVHRLNPDEVHGDCLREIAENPVLIGIRNPRHVFKDVALDENKCSESGITDLVVIDGFSCLHLAEVSVIRSPTVRTYRVRHDLNQQLMRASEYFREHFGILGRRIGAYRNFGQSGITYYELKKTVEELDWLAKR